MQSDRGGRSAEVILAIFFAEADPRPLKLCRKDAINKSKLHSKTICKLQPSVVH